MILSLYKIRLKRESTATHGHSHLQKHWFTTLTEKGMD